MTTTFHESNIDFEFDSGCDAIQYDDTAWYRKHFQGLEDSAAVDFVVVCGDTTWLLEVKDFTQNNPDRAKGQLWDIVARKVRDTLAGILAGAVRANVALEQSTLDRARKQPKLRVVFHYETPKHPGRLFRNIELRANPQQKLQRVLRSVDGKALVLDTSSTPDSVPWSATWNPPKRP